jgi:hypothetical protein
MKTTEERIEEDEQFEMLEEQIKEEVEWLQLTNRKDELECISIENLESILSKFFGRKLYLKQK